MDDYFNYATSPEPGGTLELRIDLPGTGAFTLTGVGEIDVAKHAA